MAGLPCGCYSRPAGLLRRRGGICAPGAVPALGRIACAGTSRLRRLSAGNGAVEDAGARGAPARGRGPALLQPVASESSRPQPVCGAG